MGENNTNSYIIELSELGDERGGLAVIEEHKEFPFEIRRVFYEYNTVRDAVRGNHANKNSRFGFVSIMGSCTIEVDDGIVNSEYLLDSPNKLLVVDKMTWKTMRNFTSGNVLLVLSDQEYNGEEYIRDYETFMSEVKRIRI